MSKEEIKLALEHAKRDERHLNHAETRYWCRMYRDIAEKAVEALAKPDFWEGYVPEPVKSGEGASATVTITLPAQQALDKKAENARELGLDYEPAQQEPVLQDIEQYRLQMAGISTAAIGYWKESDGIHPDYDTIALRDVAKLYAKYDELYRAQRTWVGLTDEEVSKFDVDPVEAKLMIAKLKEKNNG
jgi:hypothetical protein